LESSKLTILEVLSSVLKIYEKGDLLENLKLRKSPDYNPRNVSHTHASESFEFYSREMHTIPILTRKEEAALFQAMKGNDTKAKTRIIAGSLRLVVKFARKCTHGGVSLDDLVQEGSIGLFKAAEKFDYTKGNRFSTYAVYSIKEAVSRSTGSLGRMVSLPAKKAEHIRKAARAYNRLAQTLGREPSDRDIAAELGWPEEYAALLRGLDQTHKNLDNLAPAIKGDSAPRKKISLISKDDPAKHAILAMLQKDIDKALKELSRMERKVIKLRYGLNGTYAHSLKETGEICGISHQRVHQIEAKALHCLRNSESSHVLIGYWEEK
jgi:RNA polymerase primary sigma factor